MVKTSDFQFPKFLVIQSLSCVWLFAMPWTAACQASLHHLLELVQTHVHWVSDAIQPFHPLSSPFPLASIFPSIRAFSNESALRIRWPKYWSFSFSISPCNEYSELILFRIDWFDLLAVQGTLKSLLQHHSLIQTQRLLRVHHHFSQLSLPEKLGKKLSNSLRPHSCNRATFKSIFEA